jgi:hypothetical protein
MTRSPNGNPGRRPIARRSLLAGAVAAGTAIATGAVVRARPALAQDARTDAAKKEGKVVWYTSLALTSAEKVAKDVRGGLLPDQGGGAPHRLAARAPALDAGGAGQHQECRRRPHVRRRPLRAAQGEEAPDEAHAGGRRRLPRRVQGPRRVSLRAARDGERHRLQPEGRPRRGRPGRGTTCSIRAGAAGSDRASGLQQGHRDSRARARAPAGGTASNSSPRTSR